MTFWSSLLMMEKLLFLCSCVIVGEKWIDLRLQRDIVYVSLIIHRQDKNHLKADKTEKYQVYEHNCY